MWSRLPWWISTQCRITSHSADLSGSGVCLLIQTHHSTTGTSTDFSSKGGVLTWSRKPFSRPVLSFMYAVCRHVRYLLAKSLMLLELKTSQPIYMFSQVSLFTKKKNTSLSILYFTFSFSCTCALFWSIYDFFSQPIEQMIHVANSGTKTSSGRKWLEDITGRSDVRRRQKVRNHCFSLILWIDYRRQFVFRCFIFDHTLYRFSKLYPHWHR